MWSSEKEELNEQCRKLLAVTPAAFIFDYGDGYVRCGAASRIVVPPVMIYIKLCGWTWYRLFLEYFRNLIGERELPVLSWKIFFIRHMN
jgi:hypothetical protein